jgi:hypothetical protein
MRKTLAEFVDPDPAKHWVAANFLTPEDPREDPRDGDDDEDDDEDDDGEESGEDNGNFDGYSE